MYNKVVVMSSATLTSRVERPPAALAFLAGICRHNEIDYEIFDLNLFILQQAGYDAWKKMEAVSYFDKWATDAIDDELQQQINEVTELAVAKVLSYSPDLIALSLLSLVQIPWATKFLTELRTKSDVIVIAGGPGISYSLETGKSSGKVLAEQNLLDYYVMGEGDWVVDHFLKGEIDLGVNHKNSKYESWVPQIDKLDNLILPTYEKINFAEYAMYSDFNRPSAINITGSRGCIRRCTFCDVGHIWKKFRFRSSDHIINEIVRHYKETGIVNYFFNDSLINGSMKQFTEVMTKIVELQDIYPDFKKFTYSGQFIIRAAEQHPESMYRLMRDSGCDFIEIGVESGSEAVRMHMGKKFSNADIDYHLAMCSKYGIRNYVYMFAGYPTETLEDHNDTMNFYIKNQKYLIDDTIMGTSMVMPMVIIQGTPIYDMKDELGIILHDDKQFNKTDWSITSNPTLTTNERYRRNYEIKKLMIDLRYIKSHNEYTHLITEMAKIKDFIKQNLSTTEEETK